MSENEQAAPVMEDACRNNPVCEYARRAEAHRLAVNAYYEARKAAFDAWEGSEEAYRLQQTMDEAKGAASAARARMLSSE